MATSLARSWVSGSKEIFLTLSSVTIFAAFVLWYLQCWEWWYLKKNQKTKTKKWRKNKNKQKKNWKEFLKAHLEVKVFGVHCVLENFCRSLWYFSNFSFNWKWLFLKLTVLESRTKSEPVEKLITEKKKCYCCGVHGLQRLSAFSLSLLIIVYRECYKYTFLSSSCKSHDFKL